MYRRTLECSNQQDLSKTYFPLYAMFRVIINYYLLNTTELLSENLVEKSHDEYVNTKRASDPITLRARHFRPHLNKAMINSTSLRLLQEQARNFLFEIDTQVGRAYFQGKLLRKLSTIYFS